MLSISYCVFSIENSHGEAMHLTMHAALKTLSFRYVFKWLRWLRAVYIRARTRTKKEQVIATATSVGLRE